jgi:pimeloyl-ACP methyl ester carboxylesterase
MDASEELFVTVPTGVRLCYQTFGNNADPAVLFIGGGGSSMMDFRPEMLYLLSPPDDPHFIIRFDNRDTGRSTAFAIPEDGSAAYSLQDMAQDIIGLIEHLGVRVHLVAGSMGGPLGYIVAAKRPELVKTLSLFITSPVGGHPYDSDKLPQVKWDAIDIMASIPRASNPSDPHDKGWVDHMTGVHTAFYTLPATTEEIAEARELAEAIIRREIESGTLLTKAVNHANAALPRWPRELLRDIKCPTTVIQAGKDQFFEVAHGERLAIEIPGAAYVLLEDVGHELSKRVWKRYAEIWLKTFKKNQ